MRAPGPRCTVVARRRPDGLCDVFLVDPRTGRRAPAGAKIPPAGLEAHVRRVREQLLKAGDRVEHLEC